jgi:hypothetical protein
MAAIGQERTLDEGVRLGTGEAGESTMLMRRVVEQFRHQHWMAIAIDLVIVVLGVFLGIQASNWNEARIEQARSAVMVDAFRSELSDYIKVTGEFKARATRGLDAFDAAYARGEHPIPFYVRVPGSDRPPKSVWQVFQQSGLGDMIHPSLTYELGFFYSEVDGIADKFVRYSGFIEDQVLTHTADPHSFYDANGTLKPEYQQNMQRLREWASDNGVTVASANCLLKRLDKPKQPGPSCRPHYGPD